MSDGQRQGLFTIPSGTSFLKRLAEGLLNISTSGHGPKGEDEFALSRMRVLLPTRRAGRELRDAFLTLSKGKPLLLPRLQPIGDVDAEEIELYLSGYGETNSDIPPAISTLERQFLLAPLIQRKDPSLGLDAALSLATDLARLIDTVHTEDLDFAGLQNIVPSTLATHWQKTLEFLDIITTHWPHILAERGQIDPADRRNRLLKSLARLWQNHPPETPIIAAGSTGSIPSAGELLKTIANLPQGIVILPGLDLDLDSNSWNAITDTHPQATMRHLLIRMNKTRDDVQLWPEAYGLLSQRTELIRDIMRPADFFGQADPKGLVNGIKDLTLIETATPREEAAAIAVIIREALEVPDQTACFVTPDRTLARRVMSALRRWGIEVDDSAGGALATTASATFLLSLLRVIETNFAPLELIDFLKHNYQRLVPQEDVALLERYVLRGSRPSGGMNGLYHRLSVLDLKNDHLHHIVRNLDQSFSSFSSLTSGEFSLNEFCESILKIAEYMSGGAEFFWSRTESNSISNFIANVMEYANLLPRIELKAFGNVFRTLLKTENYRPDHEPHRRILILGQLESRLIHRDVMILGGLNEGTWPREAAHDPWMSRPMRQKFGLPTPDRITGLSAHDFVEHLSSGKVFITRSLKSDGTATVPARWIQKLKTLLNANDIPCSWPAENPYLQWIKKMDDPISPTPLYANVPQPKPPLTNRPETLSATWIEKWMRNPYRVYAEKILKLKILDPFDHDVVHAERGRFVHDVLLEFVQTYPGEMPKNAVQIILGIGQKKQSELEHVPPHWYYWWPRFERLVEWFVDEETKWRKTAVPWIQEETGAVEIYQNPATGRKFIVTAKADRIDRIKTGGAAIMDYKTGNTPLLYKVKDGTAPQLPIESYILNKGGYKNIQETPNLMVYWKLSGSHAQAGEVKPFDQIDMSEILAATEEGLTKLIDLFENPDTPYIARAVSGKLYDDEKAYAHLARTAEWSSGENNHDDESQDDGH